MQKQGIDRDLKLLKKWCSDCKYKDVDYLGDPCHDCTDDFLVEDSCVPKYYKQE